MGLSQPAVAQLQAGKPVTFVVGFAAGGAADIVGRLVAEKAGGKLGGINVVVENRGGASGNVAARAVAASEPDGHTVLVTTTSIAVSETMHKDKGYSARDLRAVSIAAGTPDSLVVHPSNPAKTLREFIDNAKVKNINFGSAGASTSTFISAQYFFKSLAKVEAVHVPFQGGAPALNSLLGAHIDAVAIALPAIIPHVAAGRLRGIAIASPRRVAAVPDVPTHQEGGYPGFAASTWVGFFVSAKTKDDVAAKLNAVINEVLKEPDVQKRLKDMGFEPNPAPLNEADAEFKKEITTWGQMVTSIGMAGK
jgi:tripartite-type tricarboxylate transporter receptor subunit TctC